MKTVSLRLTDPDGYIAHTRFPVNVITLVTPAPTEVWPLTASIAYDGVAATGEAFIYLAEGHTQLTDPVVVVEGFDLDNSLNWPELYELLNQENLIEDLRDAKLSVTFCTDNRTVSNTTVTDELVKAVKTFDIDNDELRKYVVYGFKRSFYPGTYLQKRNYVRQVFDYYEALEAEMLGNP